MMTSRDEIQHEIHLHIYIYIDEFHASATKIKRFPKNVIHLAKLSIIFHLQPRFP